MRRLWHKLFHRNPAKYPLPFGWGCRSCDAIRFGWMLADKNTDWGVVRDEIQRLPWMREY